MAAAAGSGAEAAAARLEGAEGEEEEEEAAAAAEEDGEDRGGGGGAAAAGAGGESEEEEEDVFEVEKILDVKTEGVSARRQRPLSRRRGGSGGSLREAQRPAGRAAARGSAVAPAAPGRCGGAAGAERGAVSPLSARAGAARARPPAPSPEPPARTAQNRQLRYRCSWKRVVPSFAGELLLPQRFGRFRSVFAGWFFFLSALLNYSRSAAAECVGVK